MNIVARLSLAQATVPANNCLETCGSVVHPDRLNGACHGLTYNRWKNSPSGTGWCFFFVFLFFWQCHLKWVWRGVKISWLFAGFTRGKGCARACSVRSYCYLWLCKFTLLQHKNNSEERLLIKMRSGCYLLKRTEFALKHFCDCDFMWVFADCHFQTCCFTQMNGEKKKDIFLYDAYFFVSFLCWSGMAPKL